METDKLHRPLTGGAFVVSGVPGGGTSHEGGTLTGVARRNADGAKARASRPHPLACHGR